MGADSFEGLASIRDRVDLAESITPHQIGNEVTKDRIIVDHKDPGTLETSHVDVPIRASIPGFGIGKVLAADGTEDINHHRPLFITQSGRRPKEPPIERATRRA
jgi:hypothetical protein